MNLYIGIDNGRYGFLALYDGESHDLRLSTMPVQEGRQSPRILHREEDATSWDYDVKKIKRLIRSCREQAGNRAVTAVIEEPRKRGRVGSAQAIVSLARGIGIIEACCALEGVPLLQIHPSTWKSYFKILGKTKDESIAVASQIWPRGYFPTVDSADAALLAYFYSKKRQ